jgi:hypothetical protein
VHRYFRANNTGYMVLHFEDGGSLRSWLEGLGRAPRQDELDRLIVPLLGALEIVHAADFLHRDIAPDNIMLRKHGSPVLIDFGAARGAIAGHSRTVSALVKPGYSPYEQYATSGANQGPWTDIYALGATLYHAIAGMRPPDAPSRVVEDEYIPAREAALGSYRGSFLDAIDKALRIEVRERPQSIAQWRAALLAPEPERKASRLGPRLARAFGRSRKKVPALAGAGGGAATLPDTAPAEAPASLVPAPPDAPQRQGQLIDFIEAPEKRGPAKRAPRKSRKAAKTARRDKPPAAARTAAAAAEAPADPVEPAQRPVEHRAPAEKRRKWRLPWPSRRWRVGVFRVAAAVTFASLVVAYEERVQPPTAADSPAMGDTSAFARVMQLVRNRGAVVGVVVGGVSGIGLQADLGEQPLTPDP